jgi:hypothetical protein
MSRLYLPTNYDDMTMNIDRERYVRVLSSVGRSICGGTLAFWNHRHIVIRARNPFSFSGISNDDQPMTMAAGSRFQSSSIGAVSPGNVHHVHRGAALIVGAPTGS